MNKKKLFIGLMSGTSLDGVDAALVSFDAERPALIDTHYAPYPDTLRQRCLELHQAGHDELHRAMVLGLELAGLYSDACLALLAKARVSVAQVLAIGCHGQTIRHNPAAGYSLQLNQPSLLAEHTGIRVVADFRNRDIAAGGQGAPLVPAFHDACFRDASTRQVVVNIGGIANLTDLTPGAPTTGFDCGPGNILMDAWISVHQGVRYDHDGAWAAQGHVIPALLTRLLQHPFYLQPAPKSCGRGEFNLEYLKHQLDGTESPQDVQRTLLELTASTIATAITASTQNTRILLCGGGAHNGLLKARIHALAGARLPVCKVVLTDAVGIHADWVEAIAFAWLARQTLLGQPGNLPDVTGARGPRVLGGIFPA